MLKRNGAPNGNTQISTVASCRSVRMNEWKGEDADDELMGIGRKWNERNFSDAHPSIHVCTSKRIYPPKSLGEYR